MTTRIAWFRVLRWIPALGWAAWIFWLSSQQGLPPPPGLSYAIAAIVGHFLLYAVLTATLLLGLASSSRLDRRTAAIVALIAVSYAISDELHQSFVPGRDASVFDLVVDALGTAFTLIVWARAWRPDETS